MRFGEYLRGARERAGWTQPKAAAKIGIEQSYLSKMETGKSYPSEDVFQELVKAYKLDTAKLCGTVSSDEIEKLREISSVRNAVLDQKRTKTRYERSWIIAGLVMIMLGSSLLIAQSEMSPTPIVTYRYESPGVIHPDEPVLVFDQLIKEGHRMVQSCLKSKTTEDKGSCQMFLEDASEAVAARTNYDVLDTTEYLGPNFVRTFDDKSRRRYELVDKIRSLQKSWINYLHAIGIALLAGGVVACFYISRNWR